MSISAQIKNILAKEFQSGSLFQPPLGEACRYAIVGGQQLRPQILLDLAGLGAIDFAIFIEYLHSASLVIDDLPCMDNSSERRGREALHIKYGESNAQLVAGKLQLASLYRLYKGIRKLPNHLSTRVEKYVNERVTDLYNGQYSDLERTKLESLSPRERIDQLLKMVELKTGSLFALTIYLAQVWRLRKPLLVATKSQSQSQSQIAEGVSLSPSQIDLTLTQAHSVGTSLGVMYQIIDDLRDYDESSEVNINLAHNLKDWELRNLFYSHLQRIKSTDNGFYLSFSSISSIVLKMIKTFSDLTGGQRVPPSVK